MDALSFSEPRVAGHAPNFAGAFSACPWFRPSRCTTWKTAAYWMGCCAVFRKISPWSHSVNSGRPGVELWLQNVHGKVRGFGPKSWVLGFRV